MLKSLILPLALVLPALACGGAEEAVQATSDGQSSGTPAEAKAQTVALEPAVRELRCGCKIDSVGHCGNYVADGDDWLEISNPDDHDLGKMEWCGVPETIKVEGTVAGMRTGDKIEVETLTIAGK